MRWGRGQLARSDAHVHAGWVLDGGVQGRPSPGHGKKFRSPGGLRGHGGGVASKRACRVDMGKGGQCEEELLVLFSWYVRKGILCIRHNGQNDYASSRIGGKPDRGGGGLASKPERLRVPTHLQQPLLHRP